MREKELLSPWTIAGARVSGSAHKRGVLELQVVSPGGALVFRADGPPGTRIAISRESLLGPDAVAVDLGFCAGGSGPLVSTLRSGSTGASGSLPLPERGIARPIWLAPGSFFALLAGERGAAVELGLGVKELP